MDILLVEDNDDVRESLCEMLSMYGHHVIEACNGLEAEQRLTEQTCDVIITDIMMPHKTGFDLITETKNKHPEIKIIAMSGGGTSMTSEMAVHLAGIRADKALSKPFMPQDILDAIQEVTSDN